MIHTKLRSHHLFQPRSIHRSKQKWRPRIKTSMTKLSDKRFANTVDENLHNCPTNRKRWNHIQTAIDAFGKKERQTSRLVRIRKQQSQQRKNSWLTTKGILQESQLLHSERSETTYSVLFGAAQTTTGLIFARAFNSLLTAATSVPCINKTSPRSSRL